MNRLAAIDIGTVTTRLLVADVEGSNVVPLYQRTVITHLGEGVAEHRRLAAGALHRVEQALQGFYEDMTRIEREGAHGHAAGPISRVVAIATSATRDAENSQELTDMLLHFGIELLVISGEYEAKLSFLGATSAFARSGILFSDIGGGSTELVFGDANIDKESGHVKNRIFSRHSFDIGCRRVTDLYLSSDPPSAAQMHAARLAMRQEFSSFFESLSSKPQLMLCVGGTATTIAAIHLALDPYDATRVNGTVLKRDDLEAIIERLAAMSRADREQVTGLQPARAGVIVAGALVLSEVLALTGLPSFTVSESDILDGIILDAANQMGNA